MRNPLTASEILTREFLEIRARLLQIGAALDRLDGGDKALDSDPRLDGIRRAIAVLQEPSGGRAEKIQLVFSRPYSAAWRREFELD